MRPLLILIVSFLALGCGASSTNSPGPSTTDTATTDTATTDGAERTGCRAHDDCATCLAASCNWTGGHCASECLMDVTCFGPGNEHAPSCPATQPEESTNF